MGVHVRACVRVKETEFSAFTDIAWAPPPVWAQHKSREEELQDLTTGRIQYATPSTSQANPLRSQPPA